MVGLKSWRRKRRLQRAGTAADAARDRRDWSQAIVHYARVLEERPESGPIWIQYGHALKEHGLRSDAERAYARAILLLPDDADAHLQHGHALKLLGRREEAIAAFAAALRIDHGNRSAFNELVRMGARDRIDVAIGREERQRLSIGVETGARRLLGALDEAARNAAYARMSHDEFRQDFPIGPPPGPQRLDEDILIIVVTDGQVPAQLRSTLVSLIDQVVPEWRALVVGPADLAAHPVGSFSFVEPRIAFVSATEAIAAATACARIIVLDAGTIVEPQALAWLSAAARRTGATLLYADHDHGRARGGVSGWHGIERWAPALYWTYDPDFFAAAAAIPVLVMAPGEWIGGLAADLFASGCGDAIRRSLLLEGARAACTVHVPRLLATRLTFPELALEGAGDPVRASPSCSGARPLPLAGGDGVIEVVIPTRDEPAMLGRCIASLIDCAARPELLRIVVVDNRSAQPETERLLAEGQSAGRFRVHTFDEPFNWSRANNLAARDSTAELLLFLNNDTEMRSFGWDERLRANLIRSDVGAVGARLLYPDGAVQHAGILFGVGNGYPLHEGLGASADDPGPLDRWVTRRRVSAVTGAFTGIRRAVFEAIGMFDEQALFVGYNDVDLCFRLREAGLSVIYEPAIELIHFESRTRGSAVTQAQIAWDHAERDTLHRRWGETLFHDPSYNPQWPARGEPFDGLRELPAREVAAYLERSAAPDPWRAQRREPDTGGAVSAGARSS